MLESLTLKFDLPDGTTVTEEVTLTEMTPVGFAVVAQLADPTDFIVDDDGELVDLTTDGMAAVVFAELIQRHPDWGPEHWEAVRDLIRAICEGDLEEVTDGG